MTALRRRSLDVCVAALATVLHIGLHGYSFGGCTDRLPGTSPSSDHANLLPWIHYFRDPALYPHDPQIQLGAGYGTIVWPLIAALPAALPLEWVFFACHALSLFATFVVMIALARQLGAMRRLAWIVVPVFMSVRVSPAGEATFDAAFYTRGAALPVCLAGMLLILRDRPGQALACLCIAIMLHAITAFHAAAVLAPCCLVLSPRRLVSRVIPLAVFGFAAGGIIIFVGGAASLSIGPPTAEWVELQRITNAGHLFMDHILPHAWLSLGVCALPLAWAAMSRALPRESQVLARVALIAGAALLFAGWLAESLLFSKVLLQLLPLRGLKLVMVIGMSFVPVWFAAICRQAASHAPPARVAIAVLGALTLAAMCARHEIACMCGWAITTLMASLPRGGQAAWNDNSRPPHVSWLGVVALAGLTVIPLQRDNLWVYRAADFPWTFKSNPWLDVQRWCDANLPAESLVVVPPWLEGFRTYARRSLFVDWKTGGMSLFNDNYGKEWQRRMVLLMPTRKSTNVYDDLATSYDNLTAADFQQLQSRFAITHVILKQGAEAGPMRELYSTGGLRVMAM